MEDTVWNNNKSDDLKQLKSKQKYGKTMQSNIRMTIMHAYKPINLWTIISTCGKNTSRCIITAHATLKVNK